MGNVGCGKGIEMSNVGEVRSDVEGGNGDGRREGDV